MFGALGLVVGRPTRSFPALSSAEERKRALQPLAPTGTPAALGLGRLQRVVPCPPPPASPRPLAPLRLPPPPGHTFPVNRPPPVSN